MVVRLDICLYNCTFAEMDQWGSKHVGICALKHYCNSCWSHCNNIKFMLLSAATANWMWCLSKHISDGIFIRGACRHGCNEIGVFLLMGEERRTLWALKHWLLLDNEILSHFPKMFYRKFKCTGCPIDKTETTKLEIESKRSTDLQKCLCNTGIHVLQLVSVLLHVLFSRLRNRFLLNSVLGF